MTTRKEQSDATRAAILEAGRKLLAERDVKHISISDIMKQCGLSNGLFYHYFASKDAFITALISDEWSEKAQSPCMIRHCRHWNGCANTVRSASPT